MLFKNNRVVSIPFCVKYFFFFNSLINTMPYFIQCTYCKNSISRDIKHTAEVQWCSIWWFVFLRQQNMETRDSKVRLSVSRFWLGWNNSWETDPREGGFIQLRAEHIHQTHACRRVQTHTQKKRTEELWSKTVLNASTQTSFSCFSDIFLKIVLVHWSRFGVFLTCSFRENHVQV